MRALKQFINGKASNGMILLLSASLVGVAVSNVMRPSVVSAQGPGTPASRRMSGESKAVLNAVQEAFVNIADTVEPSVVTIEAKTSPSDRPERNVSPMQDQEMPDPFRDLFRRLPRGEQPQEPRGGRSTGSGVIIRETGSTVYVLTNNHVVDGRGRFQITLNDNTEYTGILVGIDKHTDLAVLKFTAKKPLPAGSVVALGDSDRVKTGQWAIAIGSPLGYKSTMTVGVISATGRELSGLGRTNYVDLIQTDASINPGNSGGALVNLDGELVGINVAIASSGMSQGNIGIGFAIPVNAAKYVAEQLINGGKVTRGFLGVQCSQDNRMLSPELKQNLRAPEGGALAENVSAGTPAARAGMQDGDVIVRFGNHPVHSFTDLEKVVSVTRPGTASPVEVIRDGHPVRLSVTLMERPDEDTLAKRFGPAEAPDAKQPAQPESTKSKYGLNIRPADDGKGVQVVSVAPGSPAEDAGLRTGDVVLQVGETPVNGIAAFQKAVNAPVTDEGIVLRVRTSIGLRFVVLKP